ncbi:MAG: hypothetical protein Q8891_10795 [Bacteroidota bacterium]|nr:hypothetical protein [Bacteroidota bacterium]
MADGKLYDIVKTEIRNGVTLYYALHDQEEDKDVKDLADWGKNNSPDNPLPGKTTRPELAKYFRMEKLPVSPALSYLHSSTDIKTINDCFLYASPLKIIFVPPPDSLLS